MKQQLSKLVFCSIQCSFNNKVLVIQFVWYHHHHHHHQLLILLAIASLIIPYPMLTFLLQLLVYWKCPKYLFPVAFLVFLKQLLFTSVSVKVVGIYLTIFKISTYLKRNYLDHDFILVQHVGVTMNLRMANISAQPYIYLNYTYITVILVLFQNK